MASMAIVLLGLIVCGSYLLYVPLLQLYWGAYARMRPMVSSLDLVDSDGALLGARWPGLAIPPPPRFPAAAAAAAAAQPALSPVPTLFAHHADLTAAGVGEQVKGTADATAATSRASVAAAKAEAEKEKAAAAAVAAEKEREKASAEKAAAADTGGALARKHALTKELVASVSKGQVVVVTWANFHYRWVVATASASAPLFPRAVFVCVCFPAARAGRTSAASCASSYFLYPCLPCRDFVLNWVEHLTATGCTSYLVGVWAFRVFFFFFFF